MGLFDIFTGGGAKDALAAQRASLQGTLGKISGLYGGAQAGGLEALQSGQYGALGALQPAYEQARADVSGATSGAVPFLTGYTGQAAGALQTGEDAALKALYQGVGQASTAYDPLAALANRYSLRYDPSALAYSGALGVGGPEARTAALNAFQTSPAYQFALEQGLQGITRGANISGMAAGGNTLRAAAEYATNTANKEYQDWLNNLFRTQQLYAPLESGARSDVARGLATAALTGGTGAANIYTGTGNRLADLLSQTGRTGADIYTGTGRTLADLSSGYGRTAADIYGRTGSNIADLLYRAAAGEAGQAANIGQTLAGTYPQEAAADLAASQNIWNLLGGGAKLAAGGGWLPSGPYQQYSLGGPKYTLSSL